MTPKKWTVILLCLLCFCLVAFGAFMYFTDPLLQYGTESDLFSYYEYGQMYSNPGIARNYTYDAVMVGTSMIQNTNVDECDELFGCNMVRLPYSGGTTYNMKTILDICFDSGNTINRVFWELDQFQILGSHDTPRYPLPEYLYTQARSDDLSYLLNLDIFYHYSLNNAIGTLKGVSQTAERRGDTLTGNFSAQATLQGYARPAVSDETKTFEDYRARVDANLENNIFPFLQANPDTKFTFFMVPFSVLYWDAELRKGSFDAVMDATQYTMEQLLAYENVEIFFYQNEKEIITNLDNYKDYSHYGSWINSYMTQAMAEGRGNVTLENCQQVMDEMRSFIHAYDFEALFAQN